jgi:hypothetical protein
MIKMTVWHVCGTPVPSTQEIASLRTPKTAADQPESRRADDGNRTRMTSLEGVLHLAVRAAELGGSLSGGDRD